MPKPKMDGPEVSAGEAIDEVRREALRRWLHDWRGTRSNEQMISQKLAVEETNALLDRHRQRLNIWVTMRSKGGVPSYTEFVPYARVRESAFRRIVER